MVQVVDRKHDTAINSRAWWDEHFSREWDKNEGREQTFGFMTALLANLPTPELSYLCTNRTTILDWGCAMGEGVDLLGRTLPLARVAGLDFAERALREARLCYPAYEFIWTPNGEIPHIFDVVITSNCLEHFERPLEVAHEHLRHCQLLYVVLVPYNERPPLLDQHMAQFREESFPEHLGDFVRLCAQVIDVPSVYWTSQQLLVVYGSSSYLAQRDNDHEIDSKVAAMRLELLRAVQRNLTDRLLEAKIKVSELWLLAAEKDAALSELRANRDQLRTERDRYQADLNIVQADLNIVYETKAWKLTYRYRQLRAQGVRGSLKLAFLVVGFLLLSPLLAVYWAIHGLYRLLVPKALRLAFWEWRWRITHMAEARAVTASRDAIRSATPPTSQMYAFGAKVNVKHIFIFAGVPYYDIGGGQRSAQLAKTFNRMGYAVTYIYGYESSDTGDRTMPIPTVEHLYLHDITPRDLIRDLRGEPIFVFEMPHRDFEPYLQLAQTIHARAIYEHIDNWDTTLGGAFFTPQVLTHFLAKSDVVVATTKLLVEKVTQFMQADPELAAHLDKVVYCANAVDTDIFNRDLPQEQPDDLVHGAKTLLYYGSLWGEWFDWNVLLRVATACPECQINLIGDYTPLGDKIRSMPKNIHFLGPKKQVDLPAYLRHVDIALLPFKNDEIGKYISPLKVFEYVAMNVPVLATALPDIAGYPNVYASDDADDWVRFVQGYGHPNGGDASAFAHCNNWYARCDFLLDAVQSPKEDPVADTISVIVLNRNNRSVIGRCIESLIAHRRRYNYEILVVDNQSTDGSPEGIAERFGNEVVLLRNEKNGCSSGRNLAMRHATGQVIVFLDSDQFALSDHWLDTAVHVLAERRAIGAVGWAAGWFTPGSPFGPIAADLPNGGVTPDMLFQTDVAYLGTGGLVMRRETWEATAGFDEFYDPTCFEDTDLSLQIKDLGFELAYCPHINVYHLPHQTTLSGSVAHIRLMVRNWAYFTSKWRQRNAKLLECYLTK